VIAVAPVPRPDSVPIQRVQPRPEVKPEVRADPRLEQVPQPRPDPRPQAVSPPTPVSRPEVRPEPQRPLPQAQPPVQAPPEVAPAPRAEPQIAARAAPAPVAPAPRPEAPVEMRRDVAPTAVAPGAPTPSAEPTARAVPRPAPPPAQKPEPVDEGVLDRFALEIQRRVGKLVEERGERAYPRLARDRQWEGTAQIAVEFGANGQLKRIAVAESSGHAVLDERAVQMVREVLPTVPRELRSRNFTVRLPILFKLKKS
jgi:protein TonB